MKQSSKLWPTPQEVVDTGKTFVFSKKPRFFVELVSAGRNVVAPVLDRIRKLLECHATSNDETYPVRITDSSSALGADFPSVRQAEGYSISLREDGAWIAGFDQAGTVWGCHTLLQLLESSLPTVPILSIRDWPKFPIRGMHLYLPPKREIPFFIRFLDMMAENKMNTLFLEIGGGMEYERHPEINIAWKKFVKEAYRYHPESDIENRESEGANILLRHKYPSGPVALQCSRYFPKNSLHPELAGGDWLSKTEILRIIQACRERCIEIVPEVQSLSHSYYLCVAHPEISEVAADPWPNVYCPSNPKTYELLFDVMDEVVERFQPRTVHIGHDELWTLCECPKCKKMSGKQFFANDVLKIHRHLAEKGIRVAMWGDKLMRHEHGGEKTVSVEVWTGKKLVRPATWQAIRALPRDILITDWFWGNDLASQDYFAHHGYDMIFGNYDPGSFQEWEKRSASPNVKGAEISTWCEVSHYAFGHNGIFPKVILGSEALWNGRQIDKKQDQVEATKNAVRFIRRVGNSGDSQRKKQKGGKENSVDVSIRKQATRLPQSLMGKIPMQAKMSDILGLAEFRPCIDEAGFLEKSIVLDRKTPCCEPILIAKKIRTLLLLQSTTMKNAYLRPTFYSYHRGPAVLLRYLIRYVDGRRLVLNVQYGDDIGNLVISGMTAGGFRSIPLFAGEQHTFYAMEWKNPRHDVPVHSVAALLGPDATETGEIIVPAISMLG